MNAPSLRNAWAWARSRTGPHWIVRWTDRGTGAHWFEHAVVDDHGNLVLLSCARVAE